MLSPFSPRGTSANNPASFIAAALFFLSALFLAGAPVALAKQTNPSAARERVETLASHDTSRQPVKTALVLATFGTTVAQAEDPLASVKAEIARRHPGLPVFVAYTANHVIKTLRARQGKAPHGADAAGSLSGDTPRTLPEVLAALSAQGYSRIVVQSLHVTPGKEFMLINDIATRFNSLPKGVDTVLMGRPLVSDNRDARTLAAALTAAAPAARKPGEAVVYVGHGAEEYAGTLAYPALQAFLWERDPLFFVGIIEGEPDSSALLATLRAKGIKKVWLAPLLTVAGEHAANDIFGDKESWRNAFTSAGISVEAINQGLLQLPAAVTLWADHADAALKERPYLP